MSDRSLTLLAIHFQDTELQIGPERIGSKEAERSAGTETTDELDSPETAGETNDENIAGRFAGLVALAILVLALLNLTRRMGRKSTAVDPARGSDDE